MEPRQVFLQQNMHEILGSAELMQPQIGVNVMHMGASMSDRP